VVIAHEMGIESPVSTLSELIPYVTLISGKLSPVMPNSEDQAPKTRPTETAAADQPVVATTALPKPGEVDGRAREVGGRTREVGGREGPEPTRFGDWELRGRCIDF
jgi:hypothetical protein